MRGKDQKATGRARLLRRSQTPVEITLWRCIRARQLGGFKFARQEPIGAYYADFVCRDRDVIVELDGGQHLESPEDRLRDGELRVLGYRMIRFWNNKVSDNLAGVLQTVLAELERRPLTPALSRQAGRGSD